MAKEGDVIAFEAGTFELPATLSLDVSGVTVRGAGPEKTVLSFRQQGQGTGGEGLLITSSKKFTLESLSVVDAKGDAVKVQGTDQVVFRDVHVSWSDGPKETNGGYGLYPVLCSNVLIEDCRVSGASDAGIYVGQSRNIILRRNTAEGNVAGIEIENSIDADIHENTATGNTGGILVFTLPDLPKKEGRNCRVFKNRVVANNHPNFAPKGNIVASVPSGTGVMIMAFDSVEVFDNEIERNDTTGVSVVSYLITSRPVNDAGYDPFCEAVSIHSNRFSNNGSKPAGLLATMLTQVLGPTMPDVLYDGIVPPSKETAGANDRPPVLSVRDNGEATFADIDAASLSPEALLGGKRPKIVRDTGQYASVMPALPAVVLEASQ